MEGGRALERVITTCACRSGREEGGILGKRWLCSSAVICPRRRQPACILARLREGRRERGLKECRNRRGVGKPAAFICLVIGV